MSEVLYTETLDRLKESFLSAAAQGGNVEDCESLISIGADVNWKNVDGDTPLLAACRRGHAETVALLLIHGADSNLCGDDSLAPIHICARRGDSECMHALLQANTSTSAVTRDGLTAIDIAKLKGHTDIYAALMGNRGIPRVENTGLQPIVNSSSARMGSLPTLNRSNSSNSNVLVPIGRSDAGSSVSSSTTRPALSELNVPSGVARSLRPANSIPVLAESVSVKSDSKGKNSKPAVAPVNAGTASTSTPSYSIAGQQAGSYAGDDPALVSLRNALEKETAKRKALEGKVGCTA